MTDLSTLPQDVRVAIETSIADLRDGRATLCMHRSKWGIVRDYILRVTAERDALEGRIAELDTMFTAQFARRVPVEQALLDIAGGKRELPTREECKKWAVKIGVPDGALVKVDE